MNKIIELFNKQNPTFNDDFLTLDDVEFLSPYDGPLLFYNGDLDFKFESGSIGYGIYLSDSITNTIINHVNDTLFTIVGCKVELGKICKLEPNKLTYNMNKLPNYDSHQMINDLGYDYCIFDQNKIIPCCIIYMSIRNY